MSDTHKEFQKAMSDLGISSNYLGDGQYGGIYGETCYKLWQACQQLNDKRIADLLALVEMKDQALNLIHREHGLATALDALALTVDDVELVEYAEIWNHGDGKAGIEYKNDLRKGDMIHGTKLYTIKQKSINKLSVNANKEQ